MPPHRPNPAPIPPASTSTTTRRTAHTSVRRNLFNHTHRPTTGSSTSTSAETLRLDQLTAQEGDFANANEVSTSQDIVIRDRNGEFDVGEVLLLDVGVFGEEGEGQEGGRDMRGEEEKERQRLAEAVKLHCRDRNRAPSEPVELLEAVRASLRAKMVAMTEDSWMYESVS